MAKSAPNFDAVSASQNWVTALSGAGQKAAAGAARVKEAPGIAAARQAQKMLNGVTEAVTSGRWGRKVSAVSLGDWQTAYTTKGVPRIAQGAQAAQGKMQTALAEVFQYASSVHSQVANMPSDTPAARDARMLAWAQGMRQFKTRG